MKSQINPATQDLSVEPCSPTTWIVTLEEDPETGDLVMPIPQEALDANGWRIGDTLTWNIDNEGTATLTRDFESQSGS
jgi:hypothetical protein